MLKLDNVYNSGWLKLIGDLSKNYINWESKTNRYGPIPRLVAWHTPFNISYDYGNIISKPGPWNIFIQLILNWNMFICNKKLPLINQYQEYEMPNCVQCNLYRQYSNINNSNDNNDNIVHSNECKPNVEQITESADLIRWHGDDECYWSTMYVL